ncbi:hypothetical protein B0J11DRAFT_109531 [Dendryphion nanum]|uniref:Bromodomain-containing protein n=1 Tax=Dendryphion nanum TaxID=256645 RepID=A0A9P9DD88_9PLEO|nr:hypothetical protein B0J11DRAFT_109531 [Dendryphion nanum]
MLTGSQIINCSRIDSLAPSLAPSPTRHSSHFNNVHGLMAVMTSSLDKVPIDLKAASLQSTEAMAVDAETNGVHDVLLNEPEKQQPIEPAHPPAESLPQPTTNGNHTPADVLAHPTEPITNVSSGIEPIAPFLPNSQTDANSLFDGSDMAPTSVAAAAEAPTSDVRADPVPEANTQQSDTQPPDTQLSTESTQVVTETQLPDMALPAESSETAEPMDVSQDLQASTSSTDGAPTKPMTELSIDTQQTASQAPLPLSPPIVDQEMQDAPTSGKVRSREEYDDEDAPLAKRTKTDEETVEQSDFKVPELPAHTEQTNGSTSAQPNPAPLSIEQTDVVDVQTAVGSENWPTEPMTILQNKFLLERVRNTKKIKTSLAFKDPVDTEMLKIFDYHDRVKHPMDLSTMESKLKEGQYHSVRDFMGDLDQIISNTILYNGKEHPVTQAGYNMRAYFLKGMVKMPKAGVEEPVKQPKPKKPSAAPAKVKRESRAPSITAQSPTLPTPTAASPQTAWPLKNDGMPLIRRDSSTTDRPKREIHKPPPKDLPYNSAKPRKKKYQQELKFCEGVLTEILKSKYWKIAHPFLQAVDPVALNIPSYLKIIKKPMDFGTIERNLKSGQYQTAKDFYNDAQLVFQNCYKFNPEGDEVHKMGRQLNDVFDRLWKEKQDWLAAHSAPPETSPGPATEEEEEEDEEEEEIDPAQAQIIAIQQQIAKLNETAQTLLQQQTKRSSPKAAGKKKAAKQAPPKKKALAVPPPPPTKTSKSKGRSKSTAPLSFIQKQEISEGISTLGDVEMRRAVQIIRNGCPHLAGVNDEEMEIDMDEINDDTLRELYKFIKQVRGPKNAVLDDEYEPQRSHKANASKPKKNKPMGKQEQEDSIRKIQDQLRGFDGRSGSGSSQSPPGKHPIVPPCLSLIDEFTANQDDSSDDESSGSESEEE